MARFYAQQAGDANVAADEEQDEYSYTSRQPLRGPNEETGVSCPIIMIIVITMTAKPQKVLQGPVLVWSF